MQKLLIGLLCASLIVFFGCGKKAETESENTDQAQTEQTDPHAGHDHNGHDHGDDAASMAMTKAEGDTVATDSGLKYIIMQAGDGASPTPGQKVDVHYTGWLLANGQRFDSSHDRGRPFSFLIGQGKVIKGWDEGVMSMKIGEKRQLIIPPELGYGPRGAGAIIPPNAWLVFDVELLGVGNTGAAG